MVDNFDRIRELIDFESDSGLFCHCQVVTRAKDWKPLVKVREHIAFSYFIRGRDHLDRYRRGITALCEGLGARAYINLSPKSFSKLQLDLIRRLGEQIASRNVVDPKKTVNSAAGKLKPEVSKWVIDIDRLVDKPEVVKWLDSQFRVTSPEERDYLYAEMPTPGGVHLITKPFNSKAFQEEFPTIDLHKNSMGTVLYFPQSLSENGI